jgi:parallel beta-helix repeat protein
MYSLPVIVELKDSLTVISEEGPHNTIVNGIYLNFANYSNIIGFTFEGDQFGILLEWSHHLLVDNNIVRYTSASGIYSAVASEIIIRNNLIHGCATSGISSVDAAGNIEIRNNTISHCSFCGIYTDAYPIVIANNIISFNEIGIRAFNPVTLQCNDVYGNGVNYALWGMGDPTGTNGNISEDPLFCGVDPATSGNYYLQSISPCAPDNHPQSYPCGLIGLRPVFCGATAVENATWGRIKMLYR